MGNCEETKSCKPEKSSSPPPEHQQTSVHAYPDWAAMQAYYGPRMAMPPYFNSAVASGHAPPPYMWGPPQHMMPPYAAMYPHGGVYPHPGVPLAGSPMSIDSPAKSSGNSDRGLLKKLKGFDGLAMSIGNCNGNGDSVGGGNDNGHSQSGETEGSSEGSDGNTTEGGQNSGKRSREGSPNAPEVGKTEPLSGQFFPTEVNGASKKVTGLTVTVPKVSGKVGAALSANLASESELKNSPTTAAKMAAATVAMVPGESLLQNERELKRERRKQSNRESARRSRLRKQEKLKNAQQDTEDPRLSPKGSSLSTANLLSRVDNGSSARTDGDGEVYENNNNQNSGAKLRQLLDASPRADAVAAG
ncbi:common plant regulatory factor 1-like isoform X2 [Cynara cardunculus var. scolymus]|uniref:common plant regulatory factor 1-like isoform X2 n=1 Tax=Cynara cardunculus var. scolymus TaxID=59895 RepID=UPI000D623A87|nr:common plant regulatory factor 1-like isoform X2 [Cynara cardunculus var. scolymus]